MVYLTGFLLALFLVFALLMKFGPRQNAKAFWKRLYHARAAIERAFNISFLCLLVLSVVLVAVSAVLKSKTGADTSALSTHGITAVIICIFYFCVKDMERSAERGEVCECCGNCSRCRIQCTSNEKYYGVKHKEEK